MSRDHVILVPGFAGFDALGQILYYPGVSEVFTNWREEHAQGSRVVLHYFDNLPTASVHTRANRLKYYIAKRIYRGEFWYSGNGDNQHDRLTLVGHSTAGLDIRQLLVELTTPHSITIEGNIVVQSDYVLHSISHLVFLSVPHFGTNIANWVMSQSIVRQVLTSLVDRFISTISSTPRLIDNPITLAGFAENLRYAIQDVVRECNISYLEPEEQKDPTLQANAREALSQLKLYLDGIHYDFAGINDLQNAFVPPKDSKFISPAHFTPDVRQMEMKFWEKNGITTLSYATKGTRPFAFANGETIPPVNYWSPLVHGEMLELLSKKGDDVDSTYLYAYRACAGGAFTVDSAVKSLDGTNILQVAKAMDIQEWDNDGIVNTRSMLWPNGSETITICGDHADIIGHYTLGTDTTSSARNHYRYDYFVSGPKNNKFGDIDFAKVWKGIFEFALTAIKPQY